jgi:hypothetical protein
MGKKKRPRSDPSAHATYTASGTTASCNTGKSAQQLEQLMTVNELANRWTAERTQDPKNDPPGAPPGVAV